MTCCICIRFNDALVHIGVAIPVEQERKDIPKLTWCVVPKDPFTLNVLVDLAINHMEQQKGINVANSTFIRNKT